MQEFIDLGWYTVPLKGTLARNPNGSKTIPQFQKNWKQLYSQTRNLTPSKIGGVLTGRLSNIIAIDCDNLTTWNIFRSLDPHTQFIFRSKGKDGGTLIYEYTPTLPRSFSLKDSHIALDFYSRDGFVYLPTPDNATKVPLIAPLPPVPTIPTPILAILTKFDSPIAPHPHDGKENTFTASYLAPLVKQFVQNKGAYMPGLFRIITPHSYRTHSQYLKSGHLHPDNVPDGDGSAYLAAVSAILGADPSIDTELYAEAIAYVNDLFSTPMDSRRLDATVITPMTSDHKFWKYDPTWESHRTLFTTKDQSTVELVYDDTVKVYYSVDSSRQTHLTFTRDTDMYSHLQAISHVAPPAKKEVIRAVPLVTTVTTPVHPYGFLQLDDGSKRKFNVFKPSPALKVFYDPSIYAHKYTPPTTTLRFIESLVPDADMRTYLLRFIKTKLMTLKYSPVILYFLGVPGSGKGLFTQLLQEIIGNIPSPSSSEFLDKFNGWLIGAYFVELDEYGNTLASFKDKQEAIGKLKALTGKQDVDIRRMRENSYKYTHNATFIMSSNSNPLLLDEDDRRIALFNTPTSQISRVESTAALYSRLMSTVLDFCYYLATEVPELSDNDYMIPPMFKNKFNLIAENLPPADRIAYSLREGQIDELVQLANDYDCRHIVDPLQSGSIELDMLFDLYLEMTSYNGVRRSLMKALRDKNLKLTRHGDGGTKHYVSGYK